MPVAGPTSMRIFKRREQTIVIFGDVHSPGRCPDVTARHIAEYIADVIRASQGKIVDVFIEYPFFHFWKNEAPKPIPFDRQGTLVETAHFFVNKGCLRRRTAECEFNNARIHYGDPRALCADKFYSAKVLPPWREYVRYIADALKCERIAKQWAHVNPVDRDKWQEYSRKLMTELTRLYRDTWDSLRRVQDVQGEYRQSVRWIVHEVMEASETHVMDAYAVGRMLRTFEAKKGRKHQADEVRNAILYAGDFHAGNISEFLKSAGFRCVRSTMHNGVTCVMAPTPEDLASGFR
jgi:hypothetical protein